MNYSDRTNDCLSTQMTCAVRIVVLCCLLLYGSVYMHGQAIAHFVQPDKEDRCPVCGMNVSDHPRWITVIMFSDGTHEKLHGPKSMFTYYFNLKKFSEKFEKSDIATLHVTDYMTQEHIRAQTAFFVIESTIQGPMGDELIPFKDRGTAEKFIQEHGGTIISFKEITPDLINSLENIITDDSPGGR
jgi:nitrous oxide reductase accessory protein NosL